MGGGQPNRDQPVDPVIMEPVKAVHRQQLTGRLDSFRRYDPRPAILHERPEKRIPLSPSACKTPLRFDSVGCCGQQVSKGQNVIRRVEKAVHRIGVINRRHK